MKPIKYCKIREQLLVGHLGQIFLKLAIIKTVNNTEKTTMIVKV
tara:strand:- start:443 stop:574 length:132 start_codon:yes stop_codon:yes gene_type:complete